MILDDPDPPDSLTAPHDDREFLRRMNREARQLNRARWAWASFLPEFARRKVHEMDGCASIHEYAAKATGMSPRFVSDILRLEGKLRRHAPLMRLFHQGTSLSKLQEVAPHLRGHQDARKFARWIQDGCTVKQIRARLVDQGYRAPVRLRLVAQKGWETPEGGGVPAPEGARAGSGLSTPGAVPGTPGAPGTPGTPGTPEAPLEADGLRVRVPSFTLPRAQAHMLAALRRFEQQLAGRTVPLAEMLARYVEARLDHLTRRQAAGLLGPDDALNSRRRDGGTPLAEPPPGEAPDGSRGRRSRRRSLRLPRLGRRLAYVMVLHRNESSGRTTWRTRYGLLEVQDADLQGRTRIGEPLDHDALHQQARAAAAAAPGDRVPTACTRELLLDSSGLCEHPDCHDWGQDTHHQVRRGWKADHQTETLAYLCDAHHDLDHDPDRPGAVPEGPADEPDRARRRILRAKRSNQRSSRRGHGRAPGRDRTPDAKRGRGAAEG